MLDLENVLIEPYENNWKDWFIVDEIEENLKVYIYLCNGKIFYVDPRFQNFKVTGISKRSLELSIEVWYLFYEGNGSMLQRVRGHTRVIDSDTKLVEFFIKR